MRDSERAVLEQIIEFTTIAREALHSQDPERVRAAAEAIPDDAIDAQRLARKYLHAVAYELDSMIA